MRKLRIVLMVSLVGAAACAAHRATSTCPLVGTPLCPMSHCEHASAAATPTPAIR